MKHLLAPVAAVATICIFQISGAAAAEVEVTPTRRTPYSYKEETVRQVEIRGSYGRYIEFWGRTSYVSEGTAASSYTIPGTTGYLNCYGYSNQLSGSASCYGEGSTPDRTISIPGEAPREEKGWFQYLLDCRDFTFDRKGDHRAGITKMGWRNIGIDPTAMAVADRFCPIINTLPKKESK